MKSQSPFCHDYDYRFFQKVFNNRKVNIKKCHYSHRISYSFNKQSTLINLNKRIRKLTNVKNLL